MWLNAAIFYAQNLNYIINVFNTFDSLETTAMSSTKKDADLSRKA